MSNAAIDIRAARMHLSRLIDEAAAGREVIITRAGRPVARLMPLETRPARRVLGRVAGRLQIPDGFDDPLPDEVLARFDDG